MSQATSHWKLGLFVVAGVSSVLLALAWIGAQRFKRETIQVSSYFDEDVTGLEVGSTVRFRGIPIGKVARIGAAPDRRHVLVVSDIFVDALRDLGFLLPTEPVAEHPGASIPEDVRVQLVSSLITGVSTMEIDFVDVERYPVPEYPFPIPEASIFPIPSTVNQLEAGLVDALNELPTVLAATTKAVTEVEQAVKDANVRTVSEQVTSVLTQIDQTLSKIDFEALAANGTAAFGEVERLAAQLGAADGALARLLASYEKLAGDLSTAVEASAIPETTAAIRSGANAVTGAGIETGLLGRSLRAETSDLRATLAAARRLLELLERDPAALLHGR